PLQPRRSLIACDCPCSDIQVVCCSYPVGEPVFAAYRTSAGQWSIVASCCRDLSGRTGVRRIAARDEPAAAAGGAKVIKLQERAGLRGGQPLQRAPVIS